MLSLTSLQHNIFSLSKLADHDGINVKYVYKGEVYLLNIERTYEKYNRNRDRRIKIRHSDVKRGIKLVTEDCEKCGSIMITKICINKNCDANKKPLPQLKSSTPLL